MINKISGTLKINRKSLFTWVTVICAAAVLITLAVGIHKLLYFSSPNTETYVYLGSSVKYEVYYLENDVFEERVRPSGLHYLMSYVDYIEIENSFTADLPEEADISYSYIAAATLVIKYQQDANRSTDPSVYNKKYVLSNISGSITGGKIFFNSVNNANEPGGIYTVDVKKYIEIYKKFMTDQQAQMHKEDVAVNKAMRFSAELLVDFTYHINIDEYKLNETVACGLCIPLSNEVFAFENTGTPRLELPISVRKFEMPGLFATAMFTLWFSLAVSGLCCGIWQITAEKDKNRREVKKILGKYSDEIVIVTESVNLSEYAVMEVEQFRELLKLAVNLNKHIVCFRNDKKSEFCIIVDEYAYCCNFYYDSICANEILDEAERLFSEVCKFAAESAENYELIKLKEYINYVNSDKDELRGKNLPDRLNIYSGVIDTISNIMSELPPSIQAELKSFKLRLKPLIEKSEREVLQESSTS